MPLTRWLTSLGLLMATAAHADGVSFPASPVASRQTVLYHCQGGRTLTVQYINTRDGDALAYLPVQGKGHIFVSSLAGSGARYVSGAYVWWSKGNNGTLWTSPDPAATPALADCQAQPGSR